ncbi:hypothetical protein FRC09_003247 [Ceratobasidium sp. 395]|nr:hypothetical protein FRC09_003247 [Ceratobasidium sp. 395]
MDGSNLANETTPTSQRDTPPRLITDMFFHFTIGVPATYGLERTYKLEKKNPKVNLRVSQAAKRRPISSDATKPDSPTPSLSVKLNVDNTTVESQQALVTDRTFTFECSKPVRLTNLTPSPQVQAMDSESTAQPSPSRVVQTLPTDILVPIVQQINPSSHIGVLKSLSLVNQAFHYAVAPILYSNLRVIGLPQVYDFSYSFRHTLCVTSLRVFLTPDPTRPEWHPNDPNWTDGFIQTLSSLERLTSLAIQRCTDKSVAQALIDQSNNASFLPALQNLSFGNSHRFATLCLGRSIQSYGFTFRIKNIQDYDRLKGLLTNITSPREPLRELRITIRLLTKETGSKVLETIGERAPSLYRLSVLFLSGSPSHVRFDSQQVVHAMPLLNQLKSLELINVVSFPQGRILHPATVAALTEPNGPCPNLQLVNFNGAVWARTPSAVSSYTATAAHEECANSPQDGNLSSSGFPWTLRSAH